MKTQITVHTRAAATARDVDRQDREAGLARVGYHFIIDREGLFHQGRPIDSPSIHDAGDDARRSVSVCILPQGETTTDEQRKTLKSLVHMLDQGKLSMDIVSRSPILTTEEVRAWSE
jgi:hypothetical protein